MKLILFFLFFLIILINFQKQPHVNCQFTQTTPSNSLTVTLLNDNPIFKTYPKTTSSTKCIVNFSFLVSDSSLVNDVSPTLTSTNNDSTIYTALTPVKYFGNSVYYNLFGSVAYKSFTITLIGSGFSSSTYTLTFSCNKIDSTKITIENIGGTMNYIPLLGFYTIIKLVTPNGHIFDGLDGTQGISYLPITSLPNHFVFTAPPSFLISQKNLILDIGIPIVFVDTVISTFYFKSYYRELSTQPIPQLTTYPPNLNTPFQEFGFMNEPVFTYNYITNSSRPFQVINNQNAYYYTKPIKGSAGNVTFQGYLLPNLDQTFTDVANTFSFFNDLITNNFSATINGYQMPMLGSIVLEQISLDTDPIYILKFVNIKPYAFTELIYLIEGDTKIQQSWPFGFIHGTCNAYSHQVAFLRPIGAVSNLAFTFAIATLGFQQETTPIYLSILQKFNTFGPEIKTFLFSEVSTSKVSLKFDIVSTVGIDKITYAGIRYNIGETLVSGDIYTGSYEILFDSSIFSIGDLLCSDKYGNFTQLTEGTVATVIPTTLVYKPPSIYDTKLEMKSFSNITFLKNNLNLVDKAVYNIMYLQSEDIPTNLPMTLVLMDPVSISIGKTGTIKSYPIKYTPDLHLFTCNFIVPKNNIFDEIPYMIMIPNGFVLTTNQSTKLIVSQSTLDNQGPIFSSISKFGESTTIIVDHTSVGWLFTIADELNGFESGYIKVMNSFDSSIYYFNFTLSDKISGDKFNCQFKISIDVIQKCISSFYQITDVILYDSNKIPSIYNLNSQVQSEVDPTINPFINFYDSSSDGGISITKLSLLCNPQIGIQDSNQPILNSFVTYPLSIDVGSLNRMATVNFSIQLTTSGVKTQMLPIVYFATGKLELHKCSSSLISVDSAFAYYSCRTELPVGFGFPDPILISIYGIVNNGGYFNGFSTNDIKIFKPTDYFITTTLTTSQPIITSCDAVYSSDTSILVYGKGFNNVYTLILSYTTNIPTFNVFGSTAIQINNLTLPSVPFTIQLKTISQTSNQFLITPIFFSTVEIPTQTPTQTQTQTSIPTGTPTLTQTPTQTPNPTPTPTQTTPPPTATPKVCKGIPECGGISHGNCNNGECICISPFIGVDCLSKVIELPPPIVNIVRPSSNLTLFNSNNNPTTSSTTGTNSDGSSSASTSSLVGVISIVSLRELDFNRNVIKTMKFDKWDQTNLDLNKNHYSTEITSGCIVNVTTEWFESLTNIQFADQTLEMNPSTLKYNINITSYPFIDQLNTLQLVIQATALEEKVQGDTCSDKQYGETVNDNSNYLQLSVNKYSLFGRFIKRAIVDQQFINVDNTQLNDLSDQSNYYTADSYIGIEIPHYSNLIQLDPDFSMLLNPIEADSICKSKGGISRNALIGIVVGSVGGALIVVVSITLLLKYKYNIKYSINTFKLKKVNKK